MKTPSRSTTLPTRRRLLGPAACALVAAAGLLAATVPAPAAAQRATPDSATSARTVPAAEDQDRIYPGDVIKLVVWREKELTGEFPVDRRGRVVLPLVGEYDVEGRTPEAFTEQVVSDLRESVWNPAIDVRVLRRVRVMGAVNKPGLYTLDPTMTIADALASAGGRTPLGDNETVVLYRQGEKLTGELQEETRIYDSPIRSGDELVVPERGWFSRNASSVLSASVALTGILITIFAR